MVKFLFAFLLIFSSIFADENSSLDTSIKSILGTKSYSLNKGLIDTVFKQKSNFYNGNNVDIIKVIQALEENRVINLSLKSSQGISLSFSTKGSPIFFVKILSDAFRNIGYYKYSTKESHMDGSEFVWSIEYIGDSIMDPIVLDEELSKAGCKITDVQIAGSNSWSFEIDMKKAHLNIEKLDSEGTLNMQRAANEKWLDISSVSKLDISSNHANSWYPYISFYDYNLQLLKVEKVDRKTLQLNVDIPSNAVYMKISDLYTLNNIKNGLSIEAKASR